MKIDELHSALKDKTSLQINALAKKFIGKEYIIELVIHDIKDHYIYGNDSTNVFSSINFDPQFKNQLLEYSRKTKVIINAKLRNLEEYHMSPNYRTDFELTSISKV
jgi:hypothetical protein